jgi:glycosyltransferase involved in cell wall biosynthesis
VSEALRIANVHSALSERGGTERSVLEQTHYLSRRNNVTLFATYIRPGSCYGNLMRGLDIQELVGIPLSRFDLFANVGMGLALARSFESRFKDFDLLLTHHQPSRWIGYRSNRPYVVQIHSIGLDKILYPEYFHATFPWGSDVDRIAINLAIDFGGRMVMKHIDQTSVRSARSVLVQGRMIGEIVHDLYHVRPVRIPYNVDISSYNYADPKQVFLAYSIKRPLILMVSRAATSKRPDIMIRIMPKILKDHPHATLVIVTNWSLNQIRWRLLAKELKVDASVRIITASPDEINALYSGASVVGYPTQALEAVGRVPIEAMCFGVPPVVWDDEWGPAEVVRDGVGLRAKPYDIDDFADKVLTLLNDDDLRAQMGARAKRYVQSFSWERGGPQLEQVLRAAM